jgi:quinoprotein glucose dehydrogenase
MFNLIRFRFSYAGLWICCVGFTFINAHAQHQLATNRVSKEAVASASNEAELAIKKFQVLPGLKADLWAAEPMLANPVAFTFDERGRVYVCETFRLHAGVDDIREIMPWLDEELASRTVDDRLAEMKRHLGDRFSSYTNNSERIRLLEDRSGLGKADHSTIFADGFNTPLDGIGAGVLARSGKVWYANIPNLWLLRDTNADGVADVRQSLLYGFGVRVGFLGHDLHGVRFGPDGKVYFSIGDRGSNVKVGDGKTVGDTESGCVFRCNPNGSDLEVFAYGLRNPQDLVFDQYGNLFTGDNNSDSGDQARWVYVVEGADNGWRVGYQFMENPYSRGPFNAEGLWYPPFPGQAAYIVPPIANIASGPSGVAYFPGTGLPERFRDHFFLVDFRGGAANSGIHTFTLQAKGAGFELVNREHLIWGVLATDVKFGVEGGIYLTDWVEGWELTGKGRIYRVHDPALVKDPLVLETKKLLAQGFENTSFKDLAKLLSHPDMRVREEAQFALADRGGSAIKSFIGVAREKSNQLARLHAIWGIGQVACRNDVPGSQTEAVAGLDQLVELLNDPDAEVRAQSAKVLGDCHYPKAYDGLQKLLRDPYPRAQFFSALGLGKLRQRNAIPAIVAMLRENSDRDPYLRHAAVMALTWFDDLNAILAAAKDESTAVRMAALLAMRRLHREEIVMFLRDKEPNLVLEAARAINDEPINGGTRELASLIDKPVLNEGSFASPPEDGTRRRRRERPGGGSSSEPLVRRVLNANFHDGLPANARALAGFAARNDVAENMRVESLEELADWEYPSGRDRVVGLWRPMVAVRHAADARDALQPVLSDLLRTAPETVRVAAIKCTSHLSMTNVSDVLATLVADKASGRGARIEALKALAHQQDPRLEDALQVAEKDADEEVRKAATPLQALVKSSNAAPKLAQVLDRGTIGEKQAAFAALGSLPGDNSAADDILVKWLDRLQTGEVPGEIQLDLITAAGKRTSPGVNAKLVAYQASKKQDDPLNDYEEALLGGNGAEGKKVFFERPEAQCVRCHRINGEGGDVGPDLSHIGSQKERKYLLESIVLPNKQIAQGFDSVLIATKGGDTFAGVLKSENADEVVINSPDGGIQKVKKSEIQSRNKALSPMPEGIGKILSKPDLRNLVEFLSEQK